MKHSIIYKIIMSFCSLLCSYYQESYSKRVIDKFFEGLKGIYSTSITHKILEVNKGGMSNRFEGSTLHGLSNLINKLIVILQGLLKRGLEGSIIVKHDEKFRKNPYDVENRVFLILVCVGSLISYNILKIINKGFGVRTIIFDAMIVVIAISIWLFKNSTALENSFVYKLGKGFVVQPKGDLSDE